MDERLNSMLDVYALAQMRFLPMLREMRQLMLDNPLGLFNSAR